ncbi:hypothetical protein EJV47_23210 [Hymenobacter gummosus]|uniref:ATPase AAA-type core domain-containing protein n=1 Tax=Hymenobacter gummosus TaxID=1776032 RepID=A0A3S0QF30_9BACT|nr:AAA family ATPase [Hymenobacter gummosus]RTQ46065.1 hypothetical protein EJV47_23210 [Hymenobacter gummosus]
MENAINTLRIQNFKSIKDVTLQPRRVNLIIGPPNVGKSNILEAMSLLGGIVYEQTDKFMGSFIRYEELRHIFYNNIMTNTIKIYTEKQKVLLGVKPYDSRIIYLNVDEHTQDEFFARTKLPRVALPEQVDRSLLSNFFEETQRLRYDFSEQIQYAYSEIDESGAYKVPGSPDSVVLSTTPKNSWPIKPYLFSHNTDISKDYGYIFLAPPKGGNLISIIQSSALLRREIARMLKPSGQQLLLRMNDRSLEVIKDFDGLIISHPYSSIADTLQRIIFYLAAIESNDDAVILFEEPEAHSYPQYVSMLGQRIVESQNNQFFVATHSPYLVTEILEQMTRNDTLDTELAIFVAYYEDYQTKVRQLTNEEVRTIRNDAVDVFINMDRFTPAAPDA